MTRQQTWFTKQLETAAKEAQNLPSWAREEAGLKALSPDETSNKENHAISHAAPPKSQNITPATDN